MAPMKVRARARMQETSGLSVESGAEEEVRPVTRWLVPEREMKDSVKFGELGGWLVCGMLGEVDITQTGLPCGDEFFGFMGGCEVVDID
jgi:hypothetical protein